MSDMFRISGSIELIGGDEKDVDRFRLNEENSFF